QLFGGKFNEGFVDVGQAAHVHIPGEAGVVAAAELQAVGGQVTNGAVYTPVYGDLRIPGGKGRSEEGDIVGGELRVPEAGAHGDVVHVVVQVAEVLVLHGVVVADVAVIGFQVEVVEFHFHGRHLEAAFQVFHFKPAAFFGGQLKVCVDAVLHD